MARQECRGPACASAGARRSLISSSLEVPMQHDGRRVIGHGTGLVRIATRRALVTAALTGVVVAGCTRDVTSPGASPVVSTDAAAAGGRAQRFLIADQFNNRVIEVDAAGTILWHFGGGPNNVGPTAIIGVNDAQTVGDLVLMAGTGAPAGTEPA